MQLGLNIKLFAAAIVIFGIFLLIFLGGGSYYIFRSIQYRKKAKQTLDWPSVPGHVLKSYVFERWSSNVDSTSIWYEPHIEYEYQVMGMTYTSNQLFIGPAVSFLKLRRSQDIVNRLTDGVTVKVFYNPEDPSEAVLDRRSSGTSSLITGITLAFIGLFLLYIFLFPLAELLFTQ